MADDAAIANELLFGLLALQNGVISQTQLVEAFQEWSSNKSRHIAEILAEHQALDGSMRTLLESMVSAHVSRHGNDPEKSLALLSVGTSIRRQLRELGDAQLEATITNAGSRASAEGITDSTATYDVSAPAGDSERFRVLRPHASGGLGAVFVAIDKQLHREVALKQILDQHADNPESRSRFLVEAEITGALEHPGIVPVYGLGAYADGRPYYAMRFVRGDSLKESIAAFHGDPSLTRDPQRYSLELRRLLGRFTDVCNAIDYAHGREILHRDIKPGNIIIGKHGETLVVDWGLAKPLGARDATAQPNGERPVVPHSASGSSATLPGSTQGTPAYMSPEQARGDVENLGPASDVYSLGATLYSLLTGQPPFSGSVTHVMESVKTGAFAPPREVNPLVDSALNAVCLKAMATKPEDRYDSCRALADDIDHWMADAPVTAWHEPWSRTLLRWIKHHRTLVTAAAAAALVALIGAAILVSVQNRANQKLQAANAALQESYRRETARFELARKAIGVYHGEISEDLLLKENKFKELRTRLLQGAADFYGELEGLLKEQSDRNSQHALGQAYCDLGELTSVIGNKPRALEVQQKGLAVFRLLAKRADATAEDHKNLMRSLGLVGCLQMELADFSAARACLQQGAHIGEQLQTTGSGSTELMAGLGSLYVELGNAARPHGELDKSLAWYGKAKQILLAVADRNPALIQARRELAFCHNNVGAVLSDTGKPQEGLEEFEVARGIQQSLVREHPEQFNLRQDLAKTYGNIGYAQMLIGSIEDQMRALEESRRIRQALVNENPAVTEFQTDLARSSDSIGYVRLQLGELAEAREAFSQAAAIQQGVVDDNPDVVEFRGHLARYYNNMGAALSRTDMPAAVLEFQKALAVQQQIVERFPTLTRYQSELAQSLQNVGLGMRFNNDFENAVENYRKAIEILQRLADDNPTVTQYRLDIANNHQNIAVVMSLTEQRDQAADELDQAIKIQETLVSQNPDNGSFARELARSLNSAADNYLETGQLESAVNFYQRSRDIHLQLVADFPDVLDYRNGLAFALSGLGRASHVEGRLADSIESLRAAIEHRKQMSSLSPGASYDLASNLALLALLAREPNAGISGEEAAASLASAFEALKQAIAAGYDDFDALRTDDNFLLLREQEAFLKLLP